MSGEGKREAGELKNARRASQREIEGAGGGWGKKPIYRVAYSRDKALA